MIISRRDALLGLASTLCAAPLVARADNLMKLRGLVLPPYHHRVICTYMVATDDFIIRLDKAQHELKMPILGLVPLTLAQQQAFTAWGDKYLGEISAGKQKHIDLPLREAKVLIPNFPYPPKPQEYPW